MLYAARFYEQGKNLLKLSVTGVDKYDKAANDAATVNKTGYGTTAGYCGLIDMIEYETAGGGNFFPYF